MKNPITGSCHCGKNSFQIAGDIPEKLTRCTCSFCSKRGHLFAYFTPDQFSLTTSASHLGDYLWNTKTAHHYFCSTCGCGVYTDSPDYKMDGSWDGKSRRICVNSRLFDGFDAAEAPVTVIDGKNLW